MARYTPRAARIELPLGLIASDRCCTVDFTYAEPGSCLLVIQALEMNIGKHLKLQTYTGGPL